MGFAGYYEFPTYNSDAAPGDLGWKAITSSDPDTLKRKLNAEMANGRLAMMAIIGTLYQDGLTGSAWGDWSLYTDSPLRAFEAELGVQAPVGFWDPLGLSKDGNTDSFKRRRETEIKHGRVSMYACIGYIVPEYFRWPGELSPSEGIKFTDVPNGLGAFSKVPALGWFQIFAFCGALEITGWTFSKGQNIGVGKDASVNGEPGNYGLGPLGFFNLIKKDPAQRARKLNAELANGRLAMIAIIGLFFQNGVTGTTGPEMYGFGENSGVILLKVLFPSLAAFGIMGETFRRGPDEKFLKLFKYK